MINNYILETLKINSPKNLTEFENALREISQKIILSSLSKTSFFKYAAFYGGTCLRVFHGLDRFSEDLDFQVTSENFNVNLDECMSVCVNALESYGLKAFINSKTEYDNGEMRRRYIKISHYDIANEYFGGISMNKDKLISVKIEISTQYVDGANYEMNILPSPIFASIVCFDYGSLFAGKLCAILTRNWRERTKGRDYFDYMFYLSHNVKFNFEYLKNKLRYSLNKDTSHFDLNYVKELLRNKFNSTDYELVIKDIIPFTNDKSIIESINKELFVGSIDLLKSA